MRAHFNEPISRAGSILSAALALLLVYSCNSGAASAMTNLPMESSTAGLSTAPECCAVSRP